MDSVLNLASNGFAFRMARAKIKTNATGQIMGLFVGEETILKNDRLIVRKRWFDGYLRKYSILLFTDIRNNYTYKCNTIRERGSLYYGILLVINVLVYHFFRTFKIHRLRDFLLNDAKLVAIIKNLKHDQLVIFYPASICDQRVLYNARKAKKRVIMQIQSWDNILTKGYFYSEADEYHVWGSIMKEELIDQYAVEPRRINIVGVPHFMKRNDVIEKKDFILYTMSSIFIAPGEIDIVRMLSDWLRIHYPSVKLVVRLHPQNIEGPYKSEEVVKELMELSETVPNLSISSPLLASSDVLWDFSNEDNDILDSLLSQARIVINSGSTITIEGLLKQCIVIHTFFDGNKNYPFYESAARISKYPHFEKIHKYRAYWNTYNFEELSSVIERVLCGKLAFPFAEANELLKDQINLN